MAAHIWTTKTRWEERLPTCVQSYLFIRSSTYLFEICHTAHLSEIKFLSIIYSIYNKIILHTHLFLPSFICYLYMIKIEYFHFLLLKIKKYENAEKWIICHHADNTTYKKKTKYNIYFVFLLQEHIINHFCDENICNIIYVI